MALESAVGGKFTDTANLARYGWLSYGKTALHPDGLPIGFAIGPADQPETGRWVGLNCSACHTGEVSYQGKSLRVEGGPARLDLCTFLSDLAEALKATLLDGEPLLQGKSPGRRFQRFAAEVIGHPPSPEELKTLLLAVEPFAVKFEP